jgi:cellulose synthase/poly-beta-1,6-N-acetylglucosamine synthase-like glycosyltransferase
VSLRTNLESRGSRLDGPGPEAASPPAPTAPVEASSLLSIVIPCYQEAAALGRTLEHLRPHVEASRLEVIVSDDGAGDGTLELARGAGFVRVVEGHGEPRSTAKARNRGARAARSELVIFIDADILIRDPPFFFEEVRRRFRDRELLAATVKARVYPELETLGERIYHSVYDEFTWLANGLGLGTASGWCQIVRRDALFAIGGYDPVFVSGQDVDLFRRLRQRGKTCLIRELLILESPRRYRAHGLLRTALKWFFNGVAVLFLRRPYLKSYPPVR